MLHFCQGKIRMFFLKFETLMSEIVMALEYILG